MNEEQIYELLCKMFRPIERRLRSDPECQVELDGIIKDVSDRFAAENSSCTKSAAQV